MKSVLILFLKIFLFSTLFFGAISIITDFFFGDPFSERSLIKFAFYGIFMACTMVIGHIAAIRNKKLGPINAETIKVSQRKSIDSTLQQSELINKLKGDPEWNGFDLRTSDTEINFNTKPSMWSWGEKVRIIIRDTENHLNRFEISSTPKMKWTLVDYGRNLQNVSRIEKVITT